MGNCIQFEIIFNLNSYFWRVSFKEIYNHNHVLNFLESPPLTFKILNFTCLFILIIRILTILQEAVCFFTHVSCVCGWFRNRELKSAWNHHISLDVTVKLILSPENFHEITKIIASLSLDILPRYTKETKSIFLVPQFLI